MKQRHIPTTLALLLCAAGLMPAGASAQEPARGARDAARTTLLERAAESRAKGSPDAPVLVYEIADFQCPFCAKFAQDVFHQIDSAYVATGRVQWVFVNLPMPSHTNAWLATEAALCAGAVSGRFWVMHDRLFVAGQEWISAANPALMLARYAREAGVAMEPYEECVAGDKVAPLILQDVIFGSRVTGTPTFVVSNRITKSQQTVVGVKSFHEWREVLDSSLRAKD
ncbi:MAG: DsbA family protein [Longimicrobiales bacterium]